MNSAVKVLPSMVWSLMAFRARVFCDDQIVFSNSVLFDRKIMNLSRSKNATVALKMSVASETSAQQLQLLENGIKSAIHARPMDYVKDSFSIFVTDYQPGRYLEVSSICAMVGLVCAKPAVSSLLGHVLELLIHSHL